jgi:hypothetical protein
LVEEVLDFIMTGKQSVPMDMGSDLSMDNPAERRARNEEPRQSAPFDIPRGCYHWPFC